MKLPRAILILVAIALPGVTQTSWSAEPAQSQIISVQPGKQQYLVPDPDTQVVKPAPPSGEPPPARSPARARGVPAPDEAPLWKLLREERYAELDAELSRLRRAYPRWSPPARLLALKQDSEIRLRIDQSIARKDWNAVTSLAQQHPAQFACSQITFLWGLAEAHQALGNPDQAVAVYQRIIPSCPRAEDRIATLQKASAALTAEAFAELLQREAQAGQRNAGQQTEFDQITYEYHLRRFLQAVEAKDPARAIGLIGAFESALKARRDAGNATLAGWVYFEAGQRETAAAWFGMALAWEPAHEDARYGLALANFHLHRLDDADAILRQANAGDPRIQALQRDIAKSRAWARYQLGDDDEAARLFTGLYRDRPDSESADGAVLSLSRSQRWDELAGLARTLGGALEERWKTAIAQRYYGRKLFLAAEAAAPGRIAPLHNIAASSIALGAMVRDKSGDDGTSRLRLTVAPFAEGVAVFGGTHEFRLRLSRMALDSGSLPANAMIGSFPAAGGYVTAPTTRLTNSYEPHLSYRHEGWLTTYAGIGLTPSGAVLSSALFGNLGAMRQFERGNLRAEIFSQPVRESILSYTGIVDPYTGQNWGRVRRSGALVGGYTALTERWGGSAKIQAMDFQGRDVAGNQGVALNLGLATDLRLSGFDYFSVGPDLSYEAYRRNLSHFTLGHGGYFSPERLVSLGASAHFLTLEARQHIIKGDFSLGLFDKREAASPCFPAGGTLPVNPACAYAGISESGVYYSAQLMGVRRLTDNLQLGGAVVLRKSAQYDDKSLMVFLRFVLAPRGVVMSSDLPENLLQSLY